MEKRIWELDALRGLCILGMVLVHLAYCSVDMYALVDWRFPHWFLFVMDWGGLLFLLISGICATLGSRPFRRGLLTFSCGMVYTVGSFLLYLMKVGDSSILIYFGILHCLGVCSMLWEPLQRLPAWLTAIIGIVLACIGLYLYEHPIYADTFWLLPLGIPWRGFATADYFPLLPNLGFFLIGTFLGRTLYRRKETLFPGIDPQRQPLRFLRGCGTYSLFIYLLHMPIILGLLILITRLQ